MAAQITSACILSMPHNIGAILVMHAQCCSGPQCSSGCADWVTADAQQDWQVNFLNRKMRGLRSADSGAVGVQSIMQLRQRIKQRIVTACHSPLKPFFTICINTLAVFNCTGDTTTAIASKYGRLQA